MHVRYWGTRGSIASPGSETLRYGGNIPCVEVRTDGGTLLILDCGTGARKLGLALAASGPLRAHLFITHTHSDHIQGLPFFVPAFLAGSHLTIYGPAGIDRSFPRAVSGLMDYAYFPVPITELPARLEFQELGEGEFAVGEARVRAQYLNHTAPCLGYRVEVGGASLVYATDHEPFATPWWHPDRPPAPAATDGLLHIGDRRHAEFLAGADLVIHDAQYTAEEYPRKVGWGHSPVEYVVDLAVAAGVRRLALFHHDPTRADADLQRVLEACRTRVAALGGQTQLVAAAEGEAVVIPEQAGRLVGEGEPPSPTTPASARILVVEDDEDVAYVLQSVLRDDHYDVTRVATGAQALERLAYERFDLVLLDLHLPEMDGIAVTRAIRSDQRTAKLPILVLSARADVANLLAGFSEGVTDYMTKPFAMAQVRARVRSWLARMAAGHT